MAKEYRDLIVGLDIGTSKIMSVVADVQEDNTLKVLGMGVAPSLGMKRGVVVNIDACVQSIQQAVREAELMAACKITRVIPGITGSHIHSLNSTGMVAVRDREVSALDTKKALDTARAVNFGTDRHVLVVEPQEFIIDGQEVKEPIGMSGIRLESRTHIVTCAKSAAENILKCVRRCGLEFEPLMPNPMASSLATLTKDEKELGVVLVDIGAGTTDIAVFSDGAIRHTAVFPVAGELITSDIAMALRTPTEDAEDIKLRHGCAKQLLADPETYIDVAGISGRPPRSLSKQTLSGVIEPRVEEIFLLVQKELQDAGLEHLAASGVVLTGGSSVMPGMVELGEDIFLKPVRVAQPQYSGALADMVSQPRSSTVMGLLESKRLELHSGYSGFRKSASPRSGILGRLKDFVIGHF